MPSSLAARKIRKAISPRLAIRIFSNMAVHRLEHVPITWTHVIEKDSLKIKELEHVLMRHRIYPMSKYRKSRATFSRHACLMTFRAAEVKRNRWERAAALSPAARDGSRTCWPP